MALSDRLIINAAITGMVPTKDQTPHVPVTTDEIVSCVRQVRDAGAAIVHLHARDGDGTPTSSAASYVEILDRVRSEVPDIIVCVSLSGRLVSDSEQRSEPLKARPDMASLTLGSMNFPGQTSANAPQVISDLARRIYAADAVPELEVFEPGFIDFANYLRQRSVLRPPFYFNLLLGSLGASRLDPLALGNMLHRLPEDATWALAGIGSYQLDANVMAIAAGGHVRVGLEDNVYYDRGRTELADNRQLVQRIAAIGREMGREPATPEEARQIIGLSPARIGARLHSSE